MSARRGRGVPAKDLLRGRLRVQWSVRDLPCLNLSRARPGAVPVPSRGCPAAVTPLGTFRPRYSAAAEPAGRSGTRPLMRQPSRGGRRLEWP